MEIIKRGVVHLFVSVLRMYVCSTHSLYKYKVHILCVVKYAVCWSVSSLCFMMPVVICCCIFFPWIMSLFWDLDNNVTHSYWVRLNFEFAFCSFLMMLILFHALLVAKELGEWLFALLGYIGLSYFCLFKFIGSFMDCNWKRSNFNVLSLGGIEALG